MQQQHDRPAALAGLAVMDAEAVDAVDEVGSQGRR